ncbi:MAG TPA: glycosyltransferase, partial [Gemmatimonadales bacterium]|nr:glycosyltransferase [Gemmatimonadales bacterium]
LRRAQAFVFAAEEDFGIAPLEAQACGTPVIAYGKGGARDTIRPLGEAEPTGLFFEEQTVGAIVDAVQRFELEGRVIQPEACRQNALRFAPPRFRRELIEYVETQLQQRCRGSDLGSHTEAL